MHKDEQEWIDSFNQEQLVTNGWHHPSANDLIPTKELKQELDEPIPFYHVEERN